VRPDAQDISTHNSAENKPGGLSKFLPHGVCFLWDETLLLLHVVSDSLIALSYFSIPIALVVFVRRRKDLAFTGLGLALTKRIVEAQGGRVGVNSVPGNASVFHAVLPQTFRYPEASSMV